MGVIQKIKNIICIKRTQAITTDQRGNSSFLLPLHSSFCHLVQEFPTVKARVKVLVCTTLSSENFKTKRISTNLAFLEKEYFKKTFLY